MADIEHSTLPDELLHEPKGASTAAAGTVYVANGFGSGEFTRIPFSSILFTKEYVTELRGFSIDKNIDVVSSVPDTSDGVLEIVTSDVLKVDTINQLNKNTAEMLKFIQGQNKINDEVNSVLLNVRTTLNNLIASLKNEGLVA